MLKRFQVFSETVPSGSFIKESPDFANSYSYMTANNLRWLGLTIVKRNSLYRFNEHPKMDYDTFLSHFGTFGWFNLVLIFITCLAGASTMSMNSILINFLGTRRDHWCFMPELANRSFEDQVSLFIHLLIIYLFIYHILRSPASRLLGQ